MAGALTIKVGSPKAWPLTFPTALPAGTKVRAQLRDADTLALLIDCTVANGRVTIDTLGDPNANPPTVAKVNVILAGSDTSPLTSTRALLGVQVQPTSNPDDFYEVPGTDVVVVRALVYDEAP